MGIDRIVAPSKGMFKDRVVSPVTCEEMDEAIADSIAQDFDSSCQGRSKTGS